MNRTEAEKALTNTTEPKDMMSLADYIRDIREGRADFVLDKDNLLVIQAALVIAADDYAEAGLD